MRNRPKQVNYLAKYGQLAAGPLPASETGDKNTRAIRSADRIIGNNKGVAMPPKKPAGAKGPPGGRGSNIGQDRRAAAQQPQHFGRPKVDADQAIHGGVNVQMDNAAGGRIAQYRSLDDMPDKFNFGSHESAYESTSLHRAGGVGNGAAQKFNLGIDDGNDYWAASVPASRHPPQGQGQGQSKVKVSPVTNRPAPELHHHSDYGRGGESDPDDDIYDHFGRTNADAEDDNHWGVPQPAPKQQRHRGGGGGGEDAWASTSGYAPLPVQQQHGANVIEPVVLRDVPTHSQVKPSQRREPERHNGEYSPRTIPGHHPVNSPRARPAQNVIPKMSAMRSMQQEPMDPYDNGDGNEHGYGNGNVVGQMQVKSKVHVEQNHGFSPPRHHQPVPGNVLSHVRTDAAPENSHGNGRYGVPVAPPNAHARGKEVDTSKVKGDDGRKKGPPPLPAMLNRNFNDDDDDEWNDPPTGRGNKSDRSSGGGGGMGRYTSPIRDPSPRLEYDDDSVEESPTRQRYGQGAPQIRQVSSPKLSKGGAKQGIPLLRAAKALGVEPKYPSQPPSVGRGGHVRRGAPQLVSPRASYDSVNPDAPPLPADVRRDKARASQEDVPENEKLHYSKAPRKVEYKPYTLADYRDIKPKEYQEIQKLQPDLNSDVLVAKRANQQRIKDFSKQLKDFNRAEVVQQKLQHQVKDMLGERGGQGRDNKDAPGKKGAEKSKRDRALAYGKEQRARAAASAEAQVESEKQSAEAAKSRKSHAYSEDDWRGDEDNYDDAYVSAPDPSGMNYERAKEMEELENMHNDSRRQIDAIKRALKL